MSKPPFPTSPSPVSHRFYADLARWWPLISPVAEYAEEAAEFRRVLREVSPYAASLLELGSGGGHNASYLRRHYQLTLTDLSQDMLAVSQRLNPGIEHLQGDMRTLRLGRTFDAVFVQDAIDYMCREDDLAAVIATAFTHCRPGGVALFVPDETRETYEPDTSFGGSDAPNGEGARYLAWSYDPDPDDTCTTTEYAFMLRERDGTILSAAETHITGLYPCETWLRLLSSEGFVAQIHIEHTEDSRIPRRMFVGKRPAVEPIASL
jgi:SAM-dependent methyltransferase